MATWNDPDTGKNHNYFDWNQVGQGLGGIGSGLFGMFGPQGKSPSGEANKYLNQIPGKTGQYYQPFFEAGKGQLPGLEEQYGQLMGNPGGKLNEIGSEFQQSPGFKFALEQALGAANRSAAAGGMAGSPANMQQDMQLATQLGNQDYYNWLNGATGLYGQGLQGSQGLAGMGMQAGGAQANMIAQMLAQQAQNAQQEQQQKNESKGNSWMDILAGGAKLASAFI
jgi:hypothetical protein